MQPQVRLLGQVALSAPDGASVDLPTRKAWALLAYLVQSGGRSIPREELAALLWPRAAEDQARASLRQELAVVKKALGRARIAPFEAGKDAVRFAIPSELSDTGWLERALHRHDPADLRAAVAHCAGEFLGGLIVRSGPFEEWLWLERQRLKNAMLVAMSGLLRDDEAAGDAGRALALAAGMLQIDNTQEQAYRALMRQHHTAGRRTEALQQFDRCRAVLLRELDAEPSQETLDLADRIRRDRGRPAAGMAAHSPDVQPRTAGRRITGAVLCLGLDGAAELDAETDLDQLTAALGAFQARAARTVARYGGQIAASQSDRVLAVFDAAADETGGERAVLAALALAGEPVRIAPGTDLRPRAGLAWGRIALSAAGPGAGARITGIPLHRAARAEQAASGGEVLASGLPDRLAAMFETAAQPPEAVARGLS